MPQLPLRTVDVVIDTMRQELADTVWHTATCAVLAQRYHVGISTMRRALRQLVAEGALTMHQGKAPTQANTIDRESTSAEQLVTALTTGISDGRWRVGDPLPKIAALRLEFRCSNNTVMQACEQLIAHGVVHRSGRQIIIGHPLRISQRQMHADRLHDQPFVLIVGAQSRFWHFQITTTMATFYNRLVKEFDAAQYRLLFVDYKDVGSIRKQVHRPGFRGSVVLSDTKIPQLKNILTMLQSPGKRQSLGKKLILFDNADRHRALTQNLPTARRIYGAEQQALAIALQTFQELHVTNLAVIAPPIDWCDARYALLTKMAPTYGIAIQRVTDSITLWDTHYSTESFLADDVFIDECTSAHGQKYSVFKSVRRSHAQLFNILDTGCTAVLGLNDQIARRCQLALRYGREATDKPCPLLGIDNHVQTSLFGLSSIDMGFDELGYRAAHDLIGDVTVTAANGSRPHLVDRGSLT